MDIILSIIGFIIAIGILVTFHEFGHYYVARLCNVKVLNFSIGFGKSILKKKFKGSDTEFSIGLIPLGGYVKMLESHELPNDAADTRFCFDKQNVYKRFLIVFAGPAFNLILAVIFFTFVHFKGIPGIKPIIQSIDNVKNVPQIIEYEDMEIYKVNNTITKRWQDVRIEILNNVVDKSPITLYLKDNNNERHAVDLKIDFDSVLQKEGDIVQNIGITAKKPNLPPIIGNVQSDTPAHLSGLQKGDIIEKINNETITNWADWVAIIQKNPNNLLEVSVIRSNKNQQLVIVPSEKYINGKLIGFAGVSPDTESLEKYKITVAYSFFSSIHQSLISTYHYSVLTLKMIYKLVSGEANLKNLSGPISIAEYTGKSLTMGMVYFANILAILSISLGVLNLLPIPLLDGGHLLFYTFEIIFGQPVSENIQIMGQKIGLVILFGIMILAFYNDFLRLLS